MSDNQQLPNGAPEVEAPQDPFIPPWVLLALAAGGFGVALLVAFTQPTFTVIGYGGIALGVLALIAWVLLAPGQAKSAVTGRTARFGGLALIVTIVLIAVFALLYVVVRNAGVRVDLTQVDQYSLTTESLEAMERYGADPTLPEVKILAFYAVDQGTARDRDVPLLDDYVANAGGKISYEFVDPTRNPQQAQLYRVSYPGQLAVVAVNPDGSLDSENAALIERANPQAFQEDLTNAILRTAAQGEFIAYFVTVRDGESDQMTFLQQVLIESLDWTVVNATLTELANPNFETPLNDPNFDGQVMVLPGGSTALSAEELAVVQQYLADGGSLVIFAASNLDNAERTSLATAPDLNTYLYENFGFRIDAEVVLDSVENYQSPLVPLSQNLNTSAYVTTEGVQVGRGLLLYYAPNRITMNDAPPASVTTTILSQSSDSSYLIADLQRIMDGDIAQAEGDPTGPFVLGVQAENPETGARVLAFTSTTIPANELANANIDNFTVAVNSMLWTTNFNDYVERVVIPQQTRPQDQPIFADQQTLRTITLVTVIVLPFGTLFLGIYVWWSNRSRGAVKN
jgi:hypothetical protein